MDPVDYQSDLAGVSAEQLAGGFFEGWPEPRTPVEHLEILRNSDLVELAIDPETGDVVGCLTALTDGVQSAFVSLLEVLPSPRAGRCGSGRTSIECAPVGRPMADERARAIPLVRLRLARS